MSGEQKGTQLRAGGGAGHSRGYGHFHEHEGTRDPETKTAEHRHDLLGEEQEAGYGKKGVFGAHPLKPFMAKPEQLRCHRLKVVGWKNN